MQDEKVKLECRRASAPNRVMMTQKLTGKSMTQLAPFFRSAMVMVMVNGYGHNNNVAWVVMLQLLLST